MRAFLAALVLFPTIALGDPRLEKAIGTNMADALVVYQLDSPGVRVTMVASKGPPGGIVYTVSMPNIRKVKPALKGLVLTLENQPDGSPSELPMREIDDEIFQVTLAKMPSEPKQFGVRFDP